MDFVWLALTDSIQSGLIGRNWRNWRFLEMHSEPNPPGLPESRQVSIVAKLLPIKNPSSQAEEDFSKGRASEEEAMAQAAGPEERAERLARLIIEEIVLYNKQKIREGLINDNLFDLLAKDISAARRYYEDNVSPDLSPNSNYFDQALVDILVNGQGGNISSKIW